MLIFYLLQQQQQQQANESQVSESNSGGGGGPLEPQKIESVAAVVVIRNNHIAPQPVRLRNSQILVDERRKSARLSADIGRRCADMLLLARTNNNNNNQHKSKELYDEAADRENCAVSNNGKVVDAINGSESGQHRFEQQKKNLSYKNAVTNSKQV